MHFNVANRVFRTGQGFSSPWGTVPLANPDLPERIGIILASQYSLPMPILVTTFFATLLSIFRSRAALELENLALRHQIGVLQRSARKRPKLTPVDRWLWIWLSGIWSDWRWALAMVQPETVIAWHRGGFRRFWTWKVHSFSAPSRVNWAVPRDAGRGQRRPQKVSQDQRHRSDSAERRYLPPGRRAYRTSPG